jgi:hypothetical protein
MMIRWKTGLMAAALLVSPVIWAQGMPAVTVYKSASCGCCGKWAEHLRQAGFKVTTQDVDDVGAMRKKLGMPEKYASCHTAKIGNYLVEGHVPAADIQRLLKQKPKGIGISAPGMPAGSPGMEGPTPQPYETVLIQSDGSASTFVRH